MSPPCQPPPIDRAHSKRIVIMALGCLSLLALLLVQFYKVQILETEYWSKKADMQHRMVLTEPFMRGTFYSNTSIKIGQPQLPQPFAIDVPKFHLHADSSSIPEPYKAEVAHELARLLKNSNATEEELLAEIMKKSRSRKLARWLDSQAKEEIETWWHGYILNKKIPRNAIFFISDYKRSYPFGHLLGQVLHTIQDYKDDTTHQAIPTGGLEFYFNDILQGRLGKRWILRSPRNPLESGKVIVPPENGADIYLTINHYLQAVAEDELAKGVKYAGAKSGFAVMMDPFTGEILALAQYPFFDPSNYAEYFNNPELIENTHPGAISQVVEPGSTIKPITLSIALMANKKRAEENLPPLFDPEEKIATSNGFFPGRRTPAADTRLHHYLNMNMALQKSSNIYMGKVILRVVDAFGNDWYRHILSNVFGFEKKTDIEFPSEPLGMLPEPGKMHPNGKLEWSLPTPTSLAMGYNLQVNSIQMLRAYSIFANGGYFVEPTLVRQIVKTHPDNSKTVLLDNTDPARIMRFPKVLDKDIIDRVLIGMRYVTKEGGANWRADIPGFTETGKSGTARKLINGIYSKKKYFSSFLGFAPLNNPRFVLYIGINEPDASSGRYYGSLSAAPIFREIGKKTLEYLGVTPDDPYGYPSGDPRANSSKADWTQEAKALNAKYAEWNGGK